MAWNGSDKPREEASQRGEKIGGEGAPAASGAAYRMGLVAGLIVVLLGGAAVWWFCGGGLRFGVGKNVGGGAPTAKKIGSEGASAAKKIVDAGSDVTGKVVRAVAAETNRVEKPVNNDPHRVVEVVSVVTNSEFNNIVTRMRLANGRFAEHVRPARPPIFRHGTDQILQMTLCQSPRVALPPMPGRPSAEHDQDFLDSLKDPIVIKEDDSDRVKEQKAIVKDAREQIKALMDEGYHFDEILDDYKRLTSQNREIRNQALKDLREIHASGDQQMEKEYLTKINAALENMGIDPLDKPKDATEKSQERKRK